MSSKTDATPTPLEPRFVRVLRPQTAAAAWQARRDAHLTRIKVEMDLARDRAEMDPLRYRGTPATHRAIERALTHTEFAGAPYAPAMQTVEYTEEMQ